MTRSSPSSSRRRAAMPVAASPGWTRSLVAHAVTAAGSSPSSSWQPSETCRIAQSGPSVASTSPACSASSRERSSATTRAASARSRSRTAVAARRSRRPASMPSPVSDQAGQHEPGGQRLRGARQRSDPGQQQSARERGQEAERRCGAAVPGGHGSLVGRSRARTQASRELGGGLLGRDDAEVDPRAELEAGQVRQPRQHVDAPAEVVGAARRGADPEVQRRARAEPPAQPAEHVVQQRGAERPLVLEARARAPRGDHELERDARGVRRERDRLVVDRDHAGALADLLLHEVAQQVAAHRPRRVGGRPLALAGDRRGHEVERVELRVRVRERRAGLAALVDDQVAARGIAVRVQPLAPDLHRLRDLRGLEVGERSDGRRAR